MLWDFLLKNHLSYYLDKLLSRRRPEYQYRTIDWHETEYDLMLDYTFTNTSKCFGESDSSIV